MKKNTFIPEAMRGVCFECGARGHFGRDCPVRKANDGRRGKKRVRFSPEEDVAEAAEPDEGLEPRTAMDGDVDDDARPRRLNQRAQARKADAGGCLLGQLSSATVARTHVWRA